MSKIFIITFIALLLFAGCRKENPPVVPPDDTPDTTSHNFSWTTYSFGGNAGSSYFKDVTIINDSDIWAVGAIYTDSGMYNAVHWDGKKWELKKISVNYKDNSITPSLEGIFAFSTDDIWVSSGVPAHYDGNTWTQYHLFDMGVLTQNDGGVNKIWGTSSSNLYIVGGIGTIAHYDGLLWTKMESGTTIDIQDIWGSSNEQTGKVEVYAIASHKYSPPPGKKILKISGNTAIQMPDSGLPNSLSGLWFSNSSKYYIVGDGIFQKNEISSLNVWEGFHSGITEYYTQSIYGTAPNDIAVSGDFGELLHFNGLSWKSYYATTKIASGSYLAVSLLKNTLVAAGESSGKAVIVLGKR